MSSAQTIIRRIREVDPGITPETGSMDLVAGTGFDVPVQSGRADSQDVRSDLQPRETAETTFSATTSTSLDARYGSGRLVGSYDGAHQQQLEEALGAAAIAGYDSGEVNTISAEAAGNKLVNSDGWGTLVAGSDVLVSGLPANAPESSGGVFRVHIDSIDGNDAVVSGLTLQDEGPASGVRVRNSRVFRVGTELANTTATYEVFNTRNERGRIWRGVALTGYELSMPYASGATETFNYLCPQPGEAISAAGRLSLGDHTGIETPQISARKHLFGSLYPGSGFGLWLGGIQIPTVEVQTLSFSISKPMETRGAIGDLFRQGVETNGLFEINLSLDFLQLDSLDFDALRDAVDARSTVHLAFGLRTDAGQFRFYRFPKLQLGNGTSPGRQQSGRAMHQITGSARFDALHSMLQITEIDE